MKEVAGGEGAGIRRGSSADGDGGVRSGSGAPLPIWIDRASGRGGEALGRSGGESGMRARAGLPGPDLGPGGADWWGERGRDVWLEGIEGELRLAEVAP